MGVAVCGVIHVVGGTQPSEGIAGCGAAHVLAVHAVGSTSPPVGPWVAVCGAAGEFITVVDDLTGQPDGCRWGPVNFDLVDRPCTGPIFNQQCGSYLGSITILYFPATNDLVPRPNTEKYLDTLGIGNVNYIGGLKIIAYGSKLSAAFSPTLFNNLRFVAGGLQINDIDKSNRLVRIGGLDKLQQVSPNPILSTLGLGFAKTLSVGPQAK